VTTIKNQIIYFVYIEGDGLFGPCLAYRNKKSAYQFVRRRRKATNNKYKYRITPIACY